MTPQSLATLTYRVQELERRIGDFSRSLELVGRHDERITGLLEDVRDVREEVRQMKRAFYTAAVSVTGSAVLLLAGAYALFG